MVVILSCAPEGSICFENAFFLAAKELVFQDSGCSPVHIFSPRCLVYDRSLLTEGVQLSGICVFTFQAT